MEFIENAVTTFNDSVWTYLIPWILIAAGLFFGFRTALVQVRMVPQMFKAVVERPKGVGRDEDEDYGGISAFKAFTISAASRVGTGNVAGVAVAISVGGPGAVFWMWLIAILGGATAFIESTLAQVWKVREGTAYRGGPAYYMKRGLGWGPLAAIFSVAIAFTFGFVYNAFQTNAIADSIAFSFGRDDFSFRFIIGGVIAAISALIIFGGVQRIANITQVIVPFMAIAYLLIGGFVVVANFDKVPGMIGDIIGHALGFKEIAGAGLGTAMMKGIQRGLFSNEAGEGSAPNAAATAAVSHPVKQGLVQTLGVYFDTLVVCSITAFIILLGPTVNYGAEAEGVSLTQAALASEVGDWGIHFVSFILFFLAFSSILGNYYLAEANVEYLTRKKSLLILFRLVVLFFVWFGAVGSLPLVFALADTGAATMVFLNILAIVPLSGVAIKLLKNFNEQRRDGVDPIFHRDMMPELKNVECWDGSDPVTRRSPEDRKHLQHKYDLSDRTNLREY
ncbi:MULTISPECIES: alanine/glycine:cation symporter family protein [Corynebacterium]|uniref:alanine/glycine:cation symporter family protein n=1 Tax=Corynebacterium TaxID=1716 RepID=UPI0008A253E7|nr:MULTISPECIES: alanine/glycine:cation symporter family protein [Corynebacterium]MCG7246423.1 alanine:cation symporter family protein [Corynebacterium simulans]OFQ49256.1 sodium:alanine symporter [Corynebacterium sp. HMSC076D02]